MSRTLWQSQSGLVSLTRQEHDYRLRVPGYSALLPEGDVAGLRAALNREMVEPRRRPGPTETKGA